MFKKLRNRFLLLNLVIITVMMLLAFASIYTITYQDVRAEIRMELFRLTEFHNKPSGRMDPPIPLEGVPPNRQRGSAAGPPAERSVSFTVVADASWNLKYVDSWFEMDESFYEAALKAANAKQKEEGQIRLDGNEWAYVLKPMDGGYRFVFLDVTARQSILTSLIYTFLAVAFVMLIVIFFISRFFANRAIAPVQEAFDKQKRFIADASHELKTPLAIIQTNTDVLLANAEDTIANQSKWLRYIQSETDRMSKLTGDLLYLTQMEDTREAVITVPFSASEAAESVILAMEAVIFEKRITLDYDIEPGIQVRGSEQQFKQVVLILLDNAIKYTNSEGAITISLRRQHHEMVMTMANTGEGIASEHLERIFDRFYRTDSSRTRSQGGYGLGLAIAKAIVEQHKGRISAKSSLNDKTTFYVHLPVLS